MYKLHINSATGKVACVIKLDAGIAIPIDEANIDYQAYLAWLAAGNQPLPADVQQPSGGNG